MTQTATLDTIKPLTAKQERFAAEYLVDLNPTAIRAGHSANTAGAIGSENLTKPEIALAIQQAQAGAIPANSVPG